MPDRKPSSLPFESAEASEQQLWDALGDLPREAPSADLRRGFYQNLEHAGRTRFSERLRQWLGLAGNGGWVTAAACVLLGFGLARSLGPEAATPVAAPPEANRLAALEENVALLNRELVLNRLQASVAGTRLQGVMDASTLVNNDPRVAQALLVRATEDRSSSVRSAAVDALAPQLADEAVGQELMTLLEQTESPLVQYTLVDLVLRYGTAAQLRTLAGLAADDRLHPDLARHVRQSVKGDTI